MKKLSQIPVMRVNRETVRQLNQTTLAAIVGGGGGTFQSRCPTGCLACSE
jgi:hypothetical protein